jgi:copper chaperone NosL
VIRRSLAAVALFAILVGCSKREAQTVPPAHTLAADAVGHYCGMLLSEHAGPKGQILLEGQDTPVWFTSVRDTLTFLALPEEAKTIAAIYVSDMAKAPSWDQPGADNWVLAAEAVYVVGSDQQGGMGGAEVVPFSSEAAAQAFVGQHHGRILRFEEAAKSIAGAAAGNGDGP